MEENKKKEEVKKSLREQIMQNTLASFRIEGINISTENALTTLKKIELSLKR